MVMYLCLARVSDLNDTSDQSMINQKHFLKNDLFVPDNHTHYHLIIKFDIQHHTGEK